MAFSHVKDEQRTGKGVTGLSDTPGLTTAALQAKFDELGNLAIDSLNKVLDEAESENGASNVGAKVPSTLNANPNVQSIINVLAYTQSLLNQRSHTHINKSILDSITDTVKGGYDRLVTLLNKIDTIDTVLSSSSSSSIPTSAAVANYINSSTAKKDIANAMYPVGSVFMSVDATDPALLFTGTWESIESGVPSVYAWKRTD